MIGINVEFPDLSKLLEEQEREIIREVTFETANRMKTLIAEPKSGNEYPRGNNVHIASAPGEAPASDSSNLINSIMPDIKEFTGEISLAVHGVILEFGTDSAGRNRNTTIAPRPFIIPSLEEVLSDL